MSINMEGEYSFIIPIQGMFLNTHLKITNHNIITRFGEAFFLHRAIDNEFNPLQYILLGNGNIPVRRTDRRLGNEMTRKKCTASVDTVNNMIVLSAAFPLTTVREATEIGVVTLNSNNQDILISHDVFNQIDQSVFNSVSGDITVEYMYKFSSSFQKNTWNVYDETHNIYFAYEENKVLRVFENNSGYRSAGSLAELETIQGGFYYDAATKNLYVHPIGDITRSDIIVQV